MSDLGHVGWSPDFKAAPKSILPALGADSPVFPAAKGNREQVTKVSVQVPNHLLETLDAMAKRNRRSRSAEVVVVLETALRPAS